MIEDMATYMKERRELRRAEALQYLGGRCVVCGTTQDLEFDHINPETKIANVCDMLAHGSERFWAEVKKCQLLCRAHHDPHHGSAILYNDGCRCEECRLWKKLYRNGEVTSQGLPR